MVMDGLNFEWDRRKESANRKKHGVSFEEARTAFFDENARFMSDPDHSDEEDRFVLLGLSSQLRLLVVCHCYREEPETIRIISARKADRSERHEYEGFRNA
jgi:uncharacterized protein